MGRGLDDPRLLRELTEAIAGALHQVLASRDAPVPQPLAVEADSRPAGDGGAAPGAAAPLPRGDEVGFIREVKPDKVFTELVGEEPVDNPDMMLTGWRTLRNAVTLPEAAVGRYVTVPAALLAILAEKRKAVARITTSGTNYRGEQPNDWSGTGFLVGKNLLVTNHHVLNSVDVAAKALVEFDYEVSVADLAAGFGRPPASVKAFKLAPERLFVTSPTDGGLDYSFVWIEGPGLEECGFVQMERASFTARPGEQAFLIHHPKGRLKEASLDDTDVLAIETTVIHYASDTEFGSSGAPVFDRQGRLIALHHARQERKLPLPDGGTTDLVNEGIKLAAIALDLETRAQKSGPDASMAQTVLQAFTGSDTLTGFFGGLGRQVAKADAVEAVVDTYRGTDQDVDIGFWNIEWLATRWQDAEKLQGAARVIADLNLDVWGLEEVSPPAVEALVKELERLFGERYSYGLSEPDAPGSKQSTAVIWKGSVQGKRVDWPPEIDRMLRLRSDDPDVPEEAVQGRIFDRYPGLFRFKVPSTTTPYEFHVVPLHLKAMAEGSLRRQLAARILTRAVHDLAAQTPGIDIIMGGDVNTTLASGDLDKLEKAGFMALSADDEKGGSFSYLKSPKSLIDNIFVSDNLVRQSGKVDFFIVAKDRSVDKYVKKISDHRPVLARISFGARPVERLDADRLDGIIDGLLAQQDGDPRPAPRKKRKRTKA